MDRSEEVQTICLRFRDLVTDPGVTLDKHREVRQEKAHVWWGWWSKAGEKVPFNTFSELKTKARSDDGLPVLLFDSGRLLVFEAECTDIEWDSTRERLPTPESSETPEYYRDQRYLTWFRFAKIEGEPVENPSGFLKQYTYVQVDEFFDTGASRYTEFYGKKVASVEELREQDRTIWFLRDARPTDPSSELVLPGTLPSISHFPDQFSQPEGSRLLWVSDLHYGNHNFPLEESPSTGSLALRMEKALGEQSNLGGIIVSGDLTWRAEGEEFKQAEEFLRNLVSFTRLPDKMYSVAVCPGNHDVRFSDNPEEEGAQINAASEDARQAYSTFYGDLFNLHPNSFLSCGRRFLLAKAVPVEVVCLNSSLLDQSPGKFQGHGFVSDQQLEHAAKEMGWEEDATLHPTRIVVVHHHLLPVTYREAPEAGALYSVVLDAEALVRWIIRYRVKVVLHGHMHNPFFAAISRAPSIHEDPAQEHTFYVLGMGSTGVSQDHLGEEAHNVFALLDFSQSSVLKVTYYRIHKTNPTRQEGQTITIPLTNDSLH